MKCLFRSLIVLTVFGIVAAGSYVWPSELSGMQDPPVNAPPVSDAEWTGHGRDLGAVSYTHLTLPTKRIV